MGVNVSRKGVGGGTGGDGISDGLKAKSDKINHSLEDTHSR